jgi:hypothetical protein
MDLFTWSLAILAALSEVLPLLGFTRANGLLHGIKTLIFHMHADSECHIEVEVDTATTQTPSAPSGAEGPASKARLAATPP